MIVWRANQLFGGFLAFLAPVAPASAAEPIYNGLAAQFVFDRKDEFRCTAEDDIDVHAVLPGVLLVVFNESSPLVFEMRTIGYDPDENDVAVEAGVLDCTDVKRAVVPEGMEELLTHIVYNMVSGTPISADLNEFFRVFEPNFARFDWHKFDEGSDPLRFCMCEYKRNADFALLFETFYGDGQ